MGFGVGANLVLEFVKRSGASSVSLGSVDVPRATADALAAAGGGASIRVEWFELDGARTEQLAAEAMPTVDALKGAL